jgi:hypothetical protein
MVLMVPTVLYTNVAPDVMKAPESQLITTRPEVATLDAARTTTLVADWL